MKIKITELEATAEELRASNSISDGILNILRSCVNPYYSEEDSEEASEGE